MRRCMLVLVLVTLCYVERVCSNDYTPEETNAVVRVLLGHLRFYGSIDNLAKDMELRRVHCPNTWEKFLNVVDSTWTLEEKKGAFDWYLSTLGTSNLRGKSKKEQDYVICAISQCNRLTYTNSVPWLMALAQNTNGVYREDAVRFALKLGQVSDETTSFVEYMTTNHVNLAGIERGRALGEYGVKLLSGPVNNTLALSRAVEMFYRNRKSEIAVAHGCDMVLTNFLNSYVISSNRLDAALWALEDHEFTKGRYRQYFVSVTNQLLSSGQPLRWVNIGGSSE